MGTMCFPILLSFVSSVNSRTKAIVPVHYAGFSANPDKVIFPRHQIGIESLLEVIKDYDIFQSDHPLGLSLKFLDNRDSKKPFSRPAFKVEVEDLNSISKKDYKNKLYDINQANGNAILISNSKHLKRLYEVIILKKILSLNPDLRLDIDSFKTGLEIIFPSTETLVNNELFIDRDIAQYYYEINLYYEAFENKFNGSMEPILRDRK